MPLTVLSCSVTTNSITVTFSEAVDQTTATTASNYFVYDPPGIATPTSLDDLKWTGSASQQTVVWSAPSGSAPAFSAGDFVLVSISGVKAASGDVLASASVSAQVPTGSPVVLDIAVAADSITITFSKAVDPVTATNADNYTVYDPPAFSPPTTLSALNWTASLSPDQQTVTFSGSSPSFSPGDYVLVSMDGVNDTYGNPIPAADLSVQVPPGPGDTTGTITRNVEDAIAYPILTEEIGYRPSPVGLPAGGGGGMGGGGGRSSLGQVALQAVTDVLGWKANNSDPKGFIGALTQAFTLTEVEGHVQSTWVPRTYAVQTDLGGGISGAQASLYMRAKDALGQSLNLLEGLYPLDPDADPEYVKALREMARSQMTEIVKEFGAVGLPSILRIDTYFNILLGQNPAQNPSVVYDPDLIQGTLGQLRDTFGIRFANNPFNNSVADEEDITNFRVISDYMTSLMQSWLANRNFFILAPNQLAFFGTQLVLISRQFNVIAETVNEVRFTLDSVFIGPSERQTLLLEFADPALSPMFLEDVLDEVDKFMTDEGPRLLRDGGRISVTNNILPVVQSLQNMVEQAHNPTNIGQLPDGFQTVRVRNSLDDLNDQLQALINLTEQVEQRVPPSLEDLVLEGVKVSGPDAGVYTLSLLGDQLQFGGGVTISSTTPIALPRESTTFYSAQRLDVKIQPRLMGLEAGQHHITVKNPNGKSMTLLNAFTYDPNTGLIRAGSNPVPQRGSRTQHKPQRAKVRGRPQPQARRYPVAVDMGAKTGPVPAPPAAPSTARARDTGVARDLAELRKAHQDLANKVEAQSQSMAGIAHEIRNSLHQFDEQLKNREKTFEAKLDEQIRKLEKSPRERKS